MFLLTLWKNEKKKKKTTTEEIGIIIIVVFIKKIPNAWTCNNLFKGTADRNHVC